MNLYQKPFGDGVCSEPTKYNGWSIAGGHNRSHSGGLCLLFGTVGEAAAPAAGL